MYRTTRLSHGLASLMLMALCSLIALLAPTTALQAAPLSQSTSVSVTLMATDDVGTIKSQPTFSAPNQYMVLSARANGDYDYNFILFDLSVLPVNATVDAAELHLNIDPFGGPPLDVEVGRVDGAWDELTVNWSNQPAITWGGPVSAISAVGDAGWPVTPLVQAWQDGSMPNYGFVLRGLNSNGAFVSAESKETGIAPSLEITYSVPADEGPRPDLGDAPDSSNSLGMANTAYPGMNGSFPTVWSSTPANQPAGPRHANQSGEGFLGDYLSREVEADSGLDQDGVNNILNGGIDTANDDRGDDGWRNRNIKFFDCRRQTLTIRVHKAPNATLNKMVLNVWFDGNRDGDWQDIAACPQEEGPAQASYEWIVQDHFVDMSAVPAGGYLDIQVTTERVLNATPGERHWMRFMLSDALAVKPQGGLADGRGPHPNSPLGSYQFGETEDVLQKPLPPGENGELVLEKSVIAATSPALFGSMVTYEIVLRHNGGSQPIEAQIRDELPYPFHTHPQVVDGSFQNVVVESPTGGAAPLMASVDYKSPPLPELPTQVIKWQGTLAPDSEVKLSFLVHVLPLCGAGEQTQTIHNIAQARPRSGDAISDEATFTAACIGYDGIVVTQHTLLTQTVDSVLDWLDLPLQAEVTNNNPYTLTVGLWQNTLVNGAQAAAANGGRFLEQVTLTPGETRRVDYTLRMEGEFTDEVALPADFAVASHLAYCVLPGGDAYSDITCPDRQSYPQLWGNAQPITVTVRPNDLGDAPDSTNHAGAAMAAYPGIQASFPTVFDPNTGLPPGPRHSHPRPLHLGERVSREAEADIGPDQDPQNNIVPAANVPNLDRFDDGSRLDPPMHCQPGTVDVKVAISQQAADWFNEQDQLAYLNVWLDSTRDGDWADGANCQDAQGQNQPAVEHILIDYPIDVAALGPGLHALTNIMTGRILWPAPLANQPAWLRFTLSERKSNKTLQFGGIQYGDGRGYPTPFQTGETEDHLYNAQGNAPDLGVNVDGQTVNHTYDLAQVGPAFRIEIDNRGTGSAGNARLQFQVPAQLRGLAIDVLRSVGDVPVDTAQLRSQFEAGTVDLALPGLEPNSIIAILIGLVTTPGNPPVANAAEAAAGGIDLAVSVSAPGDTNPGNNSITEKIELPVEAPVVAAVAGHAWGSRETTCRTTVQLTGKVTPGIEYDLLVDGKVVTKLVESDGIWFYTLQNLAEGRHEIQAVLSGASGIVSPRDPASGLPTGKAILDVDASLPVDPLSLTLTDSQERTIHPVTLGWSWGASNTGWYMRSGETYEVGIDRCSGDPNLAIQVALGNGFLGSLRDEDGDGRYTGSFTFSPDVQAAAAAGSPLQLTVANGGTEQGFVAPLQPAVPGVVNDALSRQPLANASVTAQPVASLAQPTAQQTGSDGSYSLLVPGGLYHLDVTRDGYQPYRSGAIAATMGSLAQDVRLTPAPSGDAAHTIYITANGFEPAYLAVKPGDVVEWVNADLTGHSILRSGGLDSGVLAAGERYLVTLPTEGHYSYQDGTNLLNAGTILVTLEEAPAAGVQMFLPVISH